MRRRFRQLYSNIGIELQFYVLYNRLQNRRETAVTADAIRSVTVSIFHTGIPMAEYTVLAKRAALTVDYEA